MQIKRLKLAGFKSFVEPAELRIEPGLTGIVGPNGCGKSNLLEAIRWVMGESSAKSMRGGGMEDVIFAGTSTRPPRDFAEVSLLAERGDEAGDGERELEVVRRIERGAGSAYRANGRDVRAKDVALIFADAATGAHSPALVSQGRIAAVIAAKPAERRQMLEEAAGIAGLHVRRKDAEQKLRAAESNLARLDDILHEQEGRIAGLRRQARAAERYRALSDSIRIASARMIYARWRDAAAAADAARAEANAADAQLSGTSAQHQAAQTAQAQAAANLAKARDALLDKREKLNGIGHSLTGLEGQLEAAVQRLADLDRQLARIADDSAREDRLTRDAAEALARLETDSAACAADLTTRQGDRPALERAVQEAEAATRLTEVELARAVAEQAQVDADLRVAQAAVQAATARVTRLAQDEARLRTQLAGLGDADGLQMTLAATQAEAKDLAEQLTEARAAQETANAARPALIDARDSAESALSSVRAEVAALISEKAALDKALQGQSHKGQARALDHLRATSGWEIALAAALGDEAEAQLGGGGGASTGRFWTNADAPPAPSPPAGTQRLGDLVEAPTELAARLARIWVCEDDQGQPLGPGERLVTRAGRVRRWDGFVSAGEGAANAARLARINRLAALTAELEAKQTTQTAAEEALADARAALAAAETAISACRAAVERLVQDERTATRAMDQAETALARLMGQRADGERRLAEHAQEAVQARADAEQAADALAALPDGEAQRGRTEELRQRAGAVRDAHMGAQAALSAHEQAVSALRERNAALLADIRGWKARAGEAAKRLADMQGRVGDLETERAICAAKPASLEERIAEMRVAQARESADLAEHEAALDQAGKAEAAANAALAAAAEAMALARENRAGAQARAEAQDLRRVEMGRISGERFECPPVLLPERVGFESADVSTAEGESAAHDRLNADRERLGPVNLVAADELAEAEARFNEGQAEQAELTEAIHRLRGSIGSLNREGRERLRAAFEAVDGHFRVLFARLFNGGQAHLALVDSDDPLEAGLEIMAQPPGKRLSSLTLLSGGEQALTAVALIFALFLTNPAPICVLDEVDAPLDDANVERFCDLLDSMVTQTRTRYLIVTHNAVTMSRMHRLFGVTMIERGISRLVSVDLGTATELVA